MRGLFAGHSCHPGRCGVHLKTHIPSAGVGVLDNWLSFSDDADLETTRIFQRFDHGQLREDYDRAMPGLMPVGETEGETEDEGVS